MTNLVSIIVPVYNCKPYLEDCIQSVLAQDYGNLELLLIDDGSTDGSGQICDQYAYYDKLRVIHQKNQGVSATRNTGIRLASGDLILFLDSDDTIEPSMVSTMVAGSTITRTTAGIFQRLPPILSQTVPAPSGRF